MSHYIQRYIREINVTTRNITKVFRSQGLFGLRVLSAGKLLVIARNADFSLIVHQSILANYFLRFRVISILMYYLR